MNLEELKIYASKRGLNLGQAEKDYYQNIILFIIYSKTAKEIVFKGGTALAKCYGLNRFSEDLDFSIVKKMQIIDIVSKGLEDFGIKYEMAKNEKESEETEKYRIKIEGILFAGTEKTKCNITLDFSLREKILLEPKIITIGYHMDIIPTFDVYVMDEKEILAEKIRAVYTRKSARDLYDLSFLIKKGIEPDKEIINEKLKLYNLKFKKTELIARCKELNVIWNNELQSLVRNVPDFKEMIDLVERTF